jgi:hypothetical protein
MWKPSKRVLLVLMILTSTLGGITLSWVDWNIIKTGKGVDVYNQIDLPIIFLLLSIIFMIPYVKKLKEEKDINR